MQRLNNKNKYIWITTLIVYLLSVISMHGCFLVAFEPTNPKLNSLKKNNGE